MRTIAESRAVTHRAIPTIRTAVSRTRRRDDDSVQIIRRVSPSRMATSFRVVSPHPMHSTDAGYCYRQSGVGLSIARLCVGHDRSPAKTEKPIEMLFRRRTRVCVLRDVLDRGVHWRQLANMADLSARRRRCGLSLPLL